MCQKHEQNRIDTQLSPEGEVNSGEYRRLLPSSDRSDFVHVVDTHYVWAACD